MNIPMHNGKINKRELLRSVIRSERSEGRPFDSKRIILIARKRLEQAGKEKHIPITKSDANNAKLSLERNGTPSSATVATQATQDHQAPSTHAEQYTVAELRSAAAFLSDCGGSLTKASALIDLVSSLKE